VSDVLVRAEGRSNSVLGPVVTATLAGRCCSSARPTAFQQRTSRGTPLDVGPRGGGGRDAEEDLAAACCADWLTGVALGCDRRTTSHCSVGSGPPSAELRDDLRWGACWPRQGRMCRDRAPRVLTCRLGGTAGEGPGASRGWTAFPRPRFFGRQVPSGRFFFFFFYLFIVFILADVDRSFTVSPFMTFSFVWRDPAAQAVRPGMGLVRANCRRGNKGR